MKNYFWLNKNVNQKSKCMRGDYYRLNMTHKLQRSLDCGDGQRMWAYYKYAYGALLTLLGDVKITKNEVYLTQIARSPSSPLPGGDLAFRFNSFSPLTKLYSRCVNNIINSIPSMPGFSFFCELASLHSGHLQNLSECGPSKTCRGAAGRTGLGAGSSGKG